MSKAKAPNADKMSNSSDPPPDSPPLVLCDTQVVLVYFIAGVNKLYILRYNVNFWHFVVPTFWTLTKKIVAPGRSCPDPIFVFLPVWLHMYMYKTERTKCFRFIATTLNHMILCCSKILSSGCLVRVCHELIIDQKRSLHRFLRIYRSWRVDF
jgi:hypothetical protein